MTAEIRGLETGSVTVGTAYPVCYRRLADLVAAFEQHADNSNSTEGSNSSDTDTDLSDYTVEELRTMLSKGEITTAKYLTELSSRQKTENDAASAQTQTNTAAALGAVSE